MLHLPMTTRVKQMGNVSQTVAKLGLTIRGIYGEGSEARVAGSRLEPIVALVNLNGDDPRSDTPGGQGLDHACRNVGRAGLQAVVDDDGLRRDAPPGCRAMRAER